MTDQITFIGGRKVVNRAERVRQLFEAIGGTMSTSMFAQECIDRGIYGEEDRERAFFRFAQGDIRKHLKAPDKSGLPFAGQTMDVAEDGQHLWKQRNLWTFADYEINITEHLRNRDENHRAAKELRNECFDRFGEAPAISTLHGVDAAEASHAA